MIAALRLAVLAATAIALARSVPGPDPAAPQLPRRADRVAPAAAPPDVAAPPVRVARDRPPAVPAVRRRPDAPDALEVLWKELDADAQALPARAVALDRLPEAEEVLADAAIRHSEPRVREYAIDGLARLESPEVDRALVDLFLDDPDMGPAALANPAARRGSARRGARRAEPRRRDPARGDPLGAEVLLDLLAGEAESGARVELVRAPGERGSPGAVAALIELDRDEVDPALRSQVLTALGKIATVDAVRHLADVAVSELGRTATGRSALAALVADGELDPAIVALALPVGAP